MFLRVRNQNDVVVNLPSAVPRDFETDADHRVFGPDSIAADRAGVRRPSTRSSGRGRSARRHAVHPAEQNWLFSNRSHWYPQNQVTDYATSTMRFNVPADYKVVASGIEVGGVPVVTAAATPSTSRARDLRVRGAAAGALHRRRHQQVRARRSRRRGAGHRAASRRQRRTRVDGSRIDGARSSPSRPTQDRGRDLVPTAAEIVRLYASIVGEAPYDALTVAMVENDVPGGHSPGYFAVLNNPLPVTPLAPRHDPASFNNFPEFYIAHEIAHQWWGQAVGWKNYHEQWLSEGFAQYFAALYAKERRGDEAFRDVLRQLRRWAMDQSDQGAVYLGYRLGHIKGDSRVFRAIVYNKGAAVLHMLRRLVGDDAFFRGLRRYYRENKFKKAGTEDFQRAMEAEADISLERFFERWIYASGLPRVRYSTAVEGQDVVVRFEQTGEVYDVPVTVTLQYGDKTVDQVVVAHRSGRPKSASRSRGR